MYQTSNGPGSGTITDSAASGPVAHEILSDEALLTALWRIHPDNRCVAREALRRFGGLRGVLGASARELQSVAGLGPARAAVTGVVMELARRNLLARLSPRTVLTDPASTRRFFQAWLRDRRQEVFAALFLDTRHRVIACEALFQGTIDGTNVYPREVVLRCLGHGAAAVIFAHNHPSGVAEPSDADRRLTRRLRDALALVDIRVVDHLVVGDGETASFAERGLL